MANVALTHFAQTLRVVSLALARPVTLEIHTLIATVGSIELLIISFSLSFCLFHILTFV
jgi:hypothetical protein